MFWHSFPLAGFAFEGGDQLAQLLGYGFVDGFFVISGFLIVRSWLVSPSVRSYLTAGTLRLLPAFWVCLLTTAFIAAPLSAVLTGRNPAEVLLSPNTHTYVFKNIALWMFQYGIDGTLGAVPFPDVWNGSLWTLAWEFACYLGVMIMGLLGLLHRVWPMCITFAVVWFATIFDLGQVHPLLATALRFGLVFFAGGLLALVENRVAAPAMAYGLIGFGRPHQLAPPDAEERRLLRGVHLRIPRSAASRDGRTGWRRRRRILAGLMRCDSATRDR